MIWTRELDDSSPVCSALAQLTSGDVRTGALEQVVLGCDLEAGHTSEHLCYIGPNSRLQAYAWHVGYLPRVVTL